MNTNVISHICVVYNYSKEIKVKGGDYHRSVLGTLLIILTIWCRKIYDSRLESAIKDEPDKLGVIASFYYLSDMLYVCRGCDVAVSIYDKTACKTFRELLSVITCRHPF